LDKDNRTRPFPFIPTPTRSASEDRRDTITVLAYRNHADLHSIRHTFITNLCKTDVSPKTAQILARYNDIRITIEVYTHVDQNEQIDAIRKFKAPDEEAIKEVISVVHPSTFARWIREEAAGKLPKKRGRKRTAEEIRDLILRMAKDSDWGYRRIWGELKKMRIKISRSTVARILKENGFDPGPKRGAGTWNEFVRRHMQTLWACDFFTKKVWTLHGPVEYYVLFFVHVATRRVHIVGMTPHPNGAWMEEQARKLCEYFRQQGDAKPTHIIRDRNTKSTAKFCSILKSEGIQFRPIPPLSPNLNAFAEAWVQRVKRECLDHFMVFGETHLHYLLDCYLDYYHRFRPHQGIGNVPPDPAHRPTSPMEDAQIGHVVCHEHLGGLLKHYERRAA